MGRRFGKQHRSPLERWWLGASCRPALGATALALAVWCGVAAGQLTSADLDELRQRGEAEGWTFTVGQNPATQRPLDALCGLAIPADWRQGARFVGTPAKFDPPPSFDWRDLGACTPVKDQGACGSCWAFATTAPLESCILIKDGVAMDLSEQWLLNCNSDGYNCEDGGWWAHDYHMDKEDPCGGTGAVLESACPYTGTDGPCGCPYPHSYLIDSWAFLDGEEWIPPVDTIKWAIMTYGPLTAGVYADIEFAFYSGGVFNYDLPDEPNHGVVLVGWDDTQGSDGVWILRNSWGDGWGEDGYMRIEYGCSSVGICACFVDYAGQEPGQGPTITGQPSGGSVAQGFTFTFTIEATTDIGALRYQWQRDGEFATGELSCPMYVIYSAAPEDEGAYTCVVKDPKGATVSESAYLEVLPGAPLPATGVLGLILSVGACIAAGRSALRK